jgi:L-rhamnose mutarotase
LDRYCRRREGIMVRKAFKMKVYSEKHKEYKKRHDEIWESLKKVLKSHGAHNYSIFLDEETDSLFAYVELENEELWDKVSETEECKKWWAFMKDIMETNEDNSPRSTELKEVFYLK